MKAGAFYAWQLRLSVGGRGNRLMKTVFGAWMAGMLAMASLQAELLTPEQIGKALQELESLEEVIEGKRVNVRTSAFRAFQTAASTDRAAYEFYVDCHKRVRFDAKDARFSEFRDWRERNATRMKQDGAMMALRLQLEFLLLALKADETEPKERRPVITEVEAFVARIVGNAEELDGAYEVLRQPVNQSIFAEAYELDESLRLEDWSFSPGKFGEVYEQTVFPFYRRYDPKSLPQAWERRIDLEVAFVEETQADNPLAVEQLRTLRLPRLKWQRAGDLFENGFQSQGALAMISVLRQHPDHPDAPGWAENLRQRLEGARASAPGSGGVQEL